ncbi:MAG: carbonic anhydrase [Kordiimonadaceae bacterium]|nr:carbonic anhydrase [Kordiimonadaceae bacterium]
MTLSDRLRRGYKNFKENTFEPDRLLYEKLAAQGQHPHTLVIACSDSRVLPQQILSAGPGELFIVRNVAAMVPPYETDAGYHGTSAAIEYAVTMLKVENIVVMGHAGCGGVASVVDKNVPEDSFVGNWMRPLREWLTTYDDMTAQDPATRKRLLERAAVYLSLQNLRAFPFVAEGIKQGTLNLNGLLFNIQTGELSNVIAKHDTAFSLQNVLADEI